MLTYATEHESWLVNIVFLFCSVVWYVVLRADCVFGEAVPYLCQSIFCLMFCSLLLVCCAMCKLHLLKTYMLCVCPDSSPAKRCPERFSHSLSPSSCPARLSRRGNSQVSSPPRAGHSSPQQRDVLKVLTSLPRLPM